MTESDILNQVKNGDANAYRYFLDKYAQLCFAVAFRITNNSNDAQDIVQDSFIVAYENLNSFKGESKFSTWLYRIVTNKALAFKKKSSYFESTDILDAEDEPMSDLQEKELKLEQLEKALKSLNEKERFIIDLFYYQEQSVQDISTICDLSLANTKVILHRARKKMYDFISKQSKFAENG